MARVSCALLCGTRVLSSVSRKRQTCRQAPQPRVNFTSYGLTQYFPVLQARFFTVFAVFSKILYFGVFKSGPASRRADNFAPSFSRFGKAEPEL